MLQAISTLLWDSVLSNHSFSTAGAAQFSADLDAICRVVDSYAGPGVAEIGLRKCLEGARLISLPVKGSKALVDANAEDESIEDDWSAWDADTQERPAAVAPVQEKEKSEGEETADLGLWEVERRLFASNEMAREVLEELGLDVLTETEGRNLLRRRVELGS